MIRNSKHDPRPDEDHTTSGSTEQHHGDLRKGAYLRRRAAYQMQAGSASPEQAGGPTRKSRNKG